MRRRSALLGTLALLLPVGLTAVPQAGAAAAPPPGFAAQTVRDWETITMQVVYGPAPMGATPIPLGVPRLGYVSVAMYDAVTESLDRRRSSEAAAAANAAHDVLLSEYGHLPEVVEMVDEQLNRTMGQLPDTVATARGTKIGRAAAADMIAERADDGLDRTDIVYDKPPGAGVWQPPAAGMLAPQLGFVEPLVLRRRQMVEVDGPDPLGSAEYVRDYREVRSLGRIDSATRGPRRTETALFFNFNSATMVTSAVLALLDDRPMGVRRTSLLFATMHGAMTDSIINCWRLKYDVGFWRPVEAIDGSFEDGDPATVEEDGWLPLLTTPPYSDYVSGHGSLTSPAVATVRLMLGERTPLTLANPTMGLERSYKRLSKIERQAFNSRIWGGLHFRDAMDDAYLIGHRTARRVLAELR